MSKQTYSIDQFKPEYLHSIDILWNMVFQDYKIPENVFQKQFFGDFALNSEGCFVARRNNQIIGFVMTATKKIPFTPTGEFPGCIPVIMVHPEERRKGIGKKLLEEAIKFLLQKGETRIRAGYPTYLRGTILSFLGVSSHWQEAIIFFKKYGFEVVSSIDSMTVDLAQMEIPSYIYEREECLKNSGITLECLQILGQDKFLDFLSKVFPGSWHEQFSILTSIGKLSAEEIMTVRKNNEFIGFAGPSHISESGDACLGIGIGLQEDFRGKGIGLILLFKVLEMVRRRGGRRIIAFGAVDKSNYYGKAGFVPTEIWMVMKKDF
ncbi:hypothetical protein AUJ66_00240 [Candidatus Desantisbacteria bacterium CG1_02_38_46]|uniref:N-acetyltransferase domain-containing protein n=3 Tax=unclassified Candidatus Desantisiibacteriota TaxID=3106372 RepID=A0A2H9PAG1_9BACT|nr:MAG: hypothetical protein AUJ66_00240 [Candidatus Desantisbacteria bacterium CG1_02_38_46]PIU50992.1 MAG: hypothetical protein COS91_06800 [Candidatus Desantisbacteria bacterium CG07_land_8_20_14_0_80_39_15]PIZ15397.1 MAG: hypothetical protein COY51_05330 [Candidatus Desantisbacteria bacterium CG_4_10_14_0_8_um_filter_39_17]